MSLTIDQRAAVKAAIPTSYTVSDIAFNPTVKWWNQIDAVEPTYRIILKSKVENIFGIENVEHINSYRKALFSFNIYGSDKTSIPKISGGIIVWEIARLLLLDIKNNWNTKLMPNDIIVDLDELSDQPISDLSNIIYDNRKTKQMEYRVQFDLKIAYKVRDTDIIIL